MAPFKMEEISSGLSLPTKRHPSQAAIYLPLIDPEDRTTHEVRIDVGLQHHLTAVQHLAEPGPHPFERLIGELDRRCKLDLHSSQVLLDEILVAWDNLLENLRPAVVDEDLQKVGCRARHLLR